MSNFTTPTRATALNYTPAAIGDVGGGTWMFELLTATKNVTITITPINTDIDGAGDGSHPSNNNGTYSWRIHQGNETTAPVIIYNSGNLSTLDAPGGANNPSSRTLTLAPGYRYFIDVTMAVTNGAGGIFMDGMTIGVVGNSGSGTLNAVAAATAITMSPSTGSGTVGGLSSSFTTALDHAYLLGGLQCQTPAMTGASAPSPYAALASSTTAGKDAYKAFDHVNDGTTFWQSSGTTVATIQISKSSNISVSAVAVHFPGGSVNTNLAPKTFTIQSSADGSSWTTRNSPADQTSWANWERREFALGGLSAYTDKYWRLNITAGNGGATVAIGEIELLNEGGVTVTFADASNGAFSPTTLVLNTFNASRTYGYVAGTAGVIILSETNDGGLTHTSTVAFTATGGTTTPTVATPAAVAPSPVTGTTGAATVLGADTATAGEGGLTYTWSNTLLASGGAATFSVNGNNAAKSTTITYTKAGNYTHRCTITNGDNNTVTSDVSVTVNATATTTTVSPPTATKHRQETQAFTAAQVDQFGDAKTGTPTWSKTAGVGSIDASTGVYTAPNSTGTATVQAAVNAVNGTAAVTITDAGPAITSFVHGTDTNTTTTLTTVATDDAGESGLTYTLSCTAKPVGANAPTYSQNGNNAAKSSVATVSKAGAYTFQVAVSDGVNTAVTATTSITFAQVGTTLAITPATPTLPTGLPQTFTGVMQDQFGVALSVQPTITWSLVSGVGTINTTTGVYTAPHALGSAVIRATDGVVAGTTTITVQEQDEESMRTNIAASTTSVPTGAGYTNLVEATIDGRGDKLVATITAPSGANVTTRVRVRLTPNAAPILVWPAGSGSTQGIVAGANPTPPSTITTINVALPFPAYSVLLDATHDAAGSKTVGYEGVVA